MKKRSNLIIIFVALVLFLFAFTAIGVTYGLYDETISTNNHLVAGSLKVTLVRQKLTTINIGSDGNLVNTVDNEVKDFSTGTNDSIFGITDGMIVAPGSSFTAEMKITNGGDVAFYYYVEVFCNSMISDKTFATMLKLSVESEKGVKREVLISDGLTLGEDEHGLGLVEAGGAETFTVKLEFLDDQYNNKVESKFVRFDLKVHAVQNVILS